MDELQAGVEVTFAVFPQPPILLQPRKAALNHPTLGDDGKLVQLAAFGYLHRDILAQYLLHPPYYFGRFDVCSHLVMERNKW